MLGVIIAGGRGERMRRSGSTVPKPLTPVMGEPLILHVARMLHRHGCDQVLVTIGADKERMTTALEKIARQHPHLGLRWRDTGEDTGNGGRLRAIRADLPAGDFVMSWCDIVTDLDLTTMRSFHRAHAGLATVATVKPPPRFGRLELLGDRVRAFREKAPQDEPWINGGVFILHRDAIEQVEDSSDAWEHGPIQRLIAAGELFAFRHCGFWHAVDTLSDRDLVESAVREGRLPGPSR